MTELMDALPQKYQFESKPIIHPNILNEDIYPNIEDFAHDISEAYRQSLQHFYDLGARYIQIDDVYWASRLTVHIKFEDVNVQMKKKFELVN